jgi:hypothetical protein
MHEGGDTMSTEGQPSIPRELTIHDGAMCMDGGSIFLAGRDGTGNPVEICLNWSIESQANGTTSLCVNEVFLAKGSDAEQQLLSALERATISPPDAKVTGDTLSSNAIALGEDIHSYLDAMKKGPADALKALVEQLISNVRSNVHRCGESGE